MKIDHGKMALHCIRSLWYYLMGEWCAVITSTVEPAYNTVY